MAAITKLAIRNVFADDTKITITIDGILKSNLSIPNIKAKIKAFNEANGGNLTTKMKSANGFNWIGIDKVTITTTNRTYIF